MFGDEDARRKPCRIVTWLDRHFRLSEHLTRIQFLADDMHRAASDRVAGSTHAAVRLQPRVAGKKRRVDVEDPPPPAADEGRRKDAHVTGECNRADAAVVERATARRLEDFTLRLAG